MLHIGEKLSKLVSIIQNRNALKTKHVSVRIQRVSDIFCVQS